MCLPVHQQKPGAPHRSPQPSFDKLAECRSMNNGQLPHDSLGHVTPVGATFKRQAPATGEHIQFLA